MELSARGVFLCIILRYWYTTNAHAIQLSALISHNPQKVKGGWAPGIIMLKNEQK